MPVENVGVFITTGAVSTQICIWSVFQPQWRCTREHTHTHTSPDTQGDKLTHIHNVGNMQSHTHTQHSHCKSNVTGSSVWRASLVLINRTDTLYTHLYTHTHTHTHTLQLCIQQVLPTHSLHLDYFKHTRHCTQDSAVVSLQPWTRSLPPPRRVILFFFSCACWLVCLQDYTKKKTTFGASLGEGMDPFLGAIWCGSDRSNGLKNETKERETMQSRRNITLFH